MVLLSGVAGLLAGALSMGAGEFISVRSQRELLAATRPTQITLAAAPCWTSNTTNSCWSTWPAACRAKQPSTASRSGWACSTATAIPAFPCSRRCRKPADQHEAVGTAWSAAASSFCFFASGAIVPIIPFLLGMTGIAALVLSAALVGLALLFTGGVVGLLSGTSPATRGLRQLAIGMGAAGVTYLLGMAFGAVVA